MNPDYSNDRKSKDYLTSAPLRNADVSELASILGTIDLTTPIRQGGNFSRPKLFTRDYSPSNPSQQYAPKSTSALDSQLIRGLLQSPEGDSPVYPTAPHDEEDFSVIRFGTNCCLRGRKGRYLTAVPTIATPLPSNTNANATGQPTKSSSTSASPTFVLGVEGQGVGDLLDCLTFVNTDNKYGATVAIKAPAARERLLGLRDGVRLGFWRNLIGQGEKWLVLRASTRGLEDPGARGTFLRSGDACVLQSQSEQLIGLWEGAEGVEARLVHRDRAGAGAEVWQLGVFGTQPLPFWFNRPYLSGSFLVQNQNEKLTPTDAEARSFPGVNIAPQRPPPPLSALSVAAQERVLARELLLAMMGVEGQYVRVAAADDVNGRGGGGTSANVSTSGVFGHHLHRPLLRDVTLVMDLDEVDRSLAAQMSTLLQLCECAVRLREFIRVQSKYEYGTVSHALTAALKGVLREFDVLVGQLEPLLDEGRLPLQKMLYMLQPSRVTLRTLDNIARRLRDLTGGRLLDELFAATFEQGDEKAKQLHLHLLRKSSVPFMKMLKLWLFSGELHDPYQELLIQEDTSLSRDALQQDFNAQYWEHRYSLRVHHVPTMLAGQAEKILTAGKYLAVVRESGGYAHPSKDREEEPHNGTAAGTANPLPPDVDVDVVVVDGFDELTLDLEGAYRMAEMVDNAYKTASRDLLRLLEGPSGGMGGAGGGLTSKTNSLSSHLRSLRRFFLLENGDFFIQFMDTAAEELRKDAKDVALSRVQGLLHLAVQTSTLANDLHKEELSCTLASHNLIQHLHLIQSAGEQEMDGQHAASMSLSAQGLKGLEALILDYKGSSVKRDNRDTTEDDDDDDGQLQSNNNHGLRRLLPVDSAVSSLRHHLTGLVSCALSAAPPSLTAATLTPVLQLIPRLLIRCAIVMETDSRSQGQVEGVGSTSKYTSDIADSLQRT
eukprot:gene6290-12734_t